MSIIEIKNLDFYYNEDTHVFSSINLSLKKGQIVCLSGSNSSGKTTLLKLLSGKLISKNTIYIDNTIINKSNIEILKRLSSYVGTDTILFSKNVYEELSLVLNDEEYIKKAKIKKILDEFNLINILYESPSNLSCVQIKLVGIIKALLKGSKIICLDNIFSNFSEDEKFFVINILKKYANDNNISIIYTTNDLNDSFYSDRIVIIQNKSILLDGTPKSIYEHENILKKIGLNIPFVFELSDKLELYDLINKKYNTVEDLIEDLC